MAERAATKAAERAARQHKQEVQEAKRGLVTLNKEIMGLMKADEGPIPQEKLAEYATAIEGVKAKDPNAGAFYESQLRRFGIYNAFYTQDPAQVAGAVGGPVATSGTTKGDKLKIVIDAKQGHYSLWSRWKSRSGGEKINDFAWVAKKGNTWLQRYSIFFQKMPFNTMYGFCATKDSKVTATGTLKFAGTRNGLEYVVVGWDKASFPVQEAVDLRVWVGDRCDIDSWSRLWTDPIPGTIVWRGKEAYLLSSPDRAGQLWVTMNNLTASDRVRARKPELSDTAPASRAFKTQVRVPKCSGTKYATSKLSMKLAKCNERHDAKYDKLWDTARRQKDNARSIGGWRAADRKLKRLPEQQRKDWDRTCGPTRRKIEKAWEAGFNQLVDQYTDNPPAPMTMRAARLASEDNR